MSDDPLLERFLAGYRCPADIFDELRARDGGLDPGWSHLLGHFARLSAAELDERLRKLQRVLRDDGASYMLTGPAGAPAAQTWELDPIPQLIDGAEWRTLEAGLEERAQILDLLLKDIYGPQHLVRDGVIPPELVYANADFLRPCHGIGIDGRQLLTVYAADLMRAPDGVRRVVGDRTQMPAGLGFALENRAAMARVMPELFGARRVRSLADFFRALRRALESLAPPERSPMIGLLTSGPRDRDYFEHAYLANYLGFPLLRGADLALRNGGLFMKGVGGLDRMDVLLRYVVDYHCDPVELNDESTLGVPGLLDASRRGRVAIANPLGSGVLENPALLKYFDGIARHFLGRPPLLQSATSYWCGDPADLQRVMERLPQLVVKRLFRKPQRDRYYGYLLSEEEREALCRQIRAAPHHYCAQELQTPARLPALADSGLVGRPAVLRCFAVAGHGGGYRVMPGGLSRIGTSGSPYVVTSEPGLRAKDTWVADDRPAAGDTREHTRPLAEVSERRAVHTPSRVVENLFWMGRYCERTEMTARLLRTVFIQLGSDSAPHSDGMRQLLAALSHTTGCLPGFAGDDRQWRHPQGELRELVLDRCKIGSISATLQSLLGAAEEVRDLLSPDSHRIVNDLHGQLEALPAALAGDMATAPEEALNALVTSLLAVSGLEQESMMRDTGWYFLDMGKRLERAQETLTLIQRTCVAPAEPLDRALLLESVLLSVEALITYRQHYRTQLCLRDTLALLLFDGGNPRALAYQLHCLQSDLAQLPGGHGDTGAARARDLLREALARVERGAAGQLARPAADGRHALLDQFVAEVRDLLIQFAVAVSDRYFEHLQNPQLLGRQAMDEEF
ncbi:circularly permuted type 2 ATP-grasp protein [Microbulbifer litoralis]|uniref:circularly permuted type 2 ATP-grasp protein n=1 Tax=Microbulbifer litoralis TaxID=2933965 RepID=UPI00202955F2|nr:circularly permuted type 2 ATP-grasp protein [Microbulbifer sp. GX H0434]